MTFVNIENNGVNLGIPKIVNLDGEQINVTPNQDEDLIKIPSMRSLNHLDDLHILDINSESCFKMPKITIEDQSDDEIIDLTDIVEDYAEEMPLDKSEHAIQDNVDDNKYDDGEKNDDSSESHSIMWHLAELRTCLLKAFVGICLGFVACYAFSEDIFKYLALPLQAVMPKGTHFIFTGIADAFFVNLKIGFVAGFFLASPYVFYQLWSFVAPGLYENERKHVLPLAFLSALFFISGAAFCYFAIFPVAFKFFMSYSTESIAAMPALNEYYSFALKLLISFGLVFEMPLFSFFLAKLKLITPDSMRNFRKYAFLSAFVIAAILTPPDVFSQFMMALPMYALYEASILIVLFAQKKQYLAEVENNDN